MNHLDFKIEFIKTKQEQEKDTRKKNQIIDNENKKKNRLVISLLL
jgi:hypothetical protein